MQIRANLLPLIWSIVGVTINLSMYIIARYLGQEGPWPSATISFTAGHYPEYLIWRIGMLY